MADEPGLLLEEKRQQRAFGGSVSPLLDRLQAQHGGVAEAVALALEVGGVEGCAKGDEAAVVVVVGSGEVRNGGEDLDDFGAVVLGCEDECCATMVVQHVGVAAARNEVLRRLQFTSACSPVKSCPPTNGALVDQCIPHLNQQLEHFLVPTARSDTQGARAVGISLVRVSA